VLAGLALVAADEQWYWFNGCRLALVYIRMSLSALLQLAEQGEVGGNL